MEQEKLEEFSKKGQVYETRETQSAVEESSNKGILNHNII